MAKIQPLIQNNPKGLMGFLNWIERTGNRIPHPFTVFLYLILFVLVASWIGSYLGLSSIHPGTGKELHIKSLVSTEGVHYILESTVDNFVKFKPLGLVLVMVLGIGLADKVGLFEATIKKLLLNAPKAVITYGVLFAAFIGHLASDAAYVIIPPLAAMVFRSFGRHPVAGLVTGIAGVGCGFTANIFIAGTDVLLSGITTEVARAVNPNVQVTPIDNWYFMSLSVFVLTIVGAFITERIVEPRLGTYQGEDSIPQMIELSPLVNKALRNAMVAALIYIGFLATVLFIPHSPLRGEDGGILTSPFMEGIIPIILCFFIVTGLAYGITMKKVTCTADVVKLMSDSIKDMSGFIALAFIISQFIAYLNWSNLTMWIAVSGSEMLKAVHLTGFPAILLFTFVAVIMALLITSGSALWSVLAPIFVPMLMLLNFHPAFIQVAYRIADSATNMITPLNPFVAVMLGFLARYDKKAGLGTHISLIFPYTVAFLIIWVLMLCLFGLLGIPVGPGVTMYLK
ncbi:AbgT family transporter [Paenibacillus elgii]